MNSTIILLIQQTADAIYYDIQQPIPLSVINKKLTLMSNKIIELQKSHGSRLGFHSCDKISIISQSIVQSEQFGSGHMFSENNSKSCSVQVNNRNNVSTDCRYRFEEEPQDKELAYRDEIQQQLLVFGLTFIQLLESFKDIQISPTNRLFIEELKDRLNNSLVSNYSQFDDILRQTQEQINGLYKEVEQTQSLRGMIEKIQEKIDYFNPNQPAHQLIHQDLSNDLLFLHKKLSLIHEDALSSEIENIYQKFFDVRQVQNQSQLVRNSLEQIHNMSKQQQQPILLPLSMYYSKDPHILNIRNEFRQKIQLQQQHQNSKGSFKLDILKPLTVQPLVSKLFPYEASIRIRTLQSHNNIPQEYIITPRGMINSLRKPACFSKTKQMDNVIRQYFQSDHIVNISQFEEKLSLQLKNHNSLFENLVVKDIFIGSRLFDQYKQSLNDIVLPQDDQYPIAPIHARIHYSHVLGGLQCFTNSNFRLFLAGSFKRFPNVQSIRKLPPIIIQKIFQFLNEKESIYINDCGSQTGTQVQLQFQNLLGVNQKIAQQHLQVLSSGTKLLISLGPYSKVIDAISCLVSNNLSDSTTIQVNKLFQQGLWEYLYCLQTHNSYLSSTHDFSSKSCLVFLEAQQIKNQVSSKLDTKIIIQSVKLYILNDNDTQSLSFMDKNKFDQNNYLCMDDSIHYVDVKGFGSVLQCKMQAKTNEFVFFQSHKSSLDDAIW